MLKETLSLLAAGYSKKEIDAMREADKKAEAEAAAKKAEDEKQAAAKKAEDEKQAAAKKAEDDKKAESEAEKKIAELEKQLADAKEDLKKSQAGNVNNSIPADKKATNEEKTAELLSHLAEYM